MIFDVIQSLCNERDISVNQLEKMMGVPQSSIQKIKTSVPKADRLHDIAEFFGVPMDRFFEDKYDDLDSLKEHHQFAEQEYDNLIPVALRNVLYNDDNENIKTTSHYHVSAGASSPVVLLENEGVTGFDDEYEYATIVGTSMYPELKTGDQIKIKRQVQTTPTDFSLVNIGNNYSTVKFVEITNSGIWLTALNKEAYPDKFYTIQEVLTLPIVIVGKVIESKRSYR